MGMFYRCMVCGAEFSEAEAFDGRDHGTALCCPRCGADAWYLEVHVFGDGG